MVFDHRHGHRPSAKRMQSEKSRPSKIKDYVALTLTTFGVGYIPGAPGTYGSMVGVALYLVSWKLPFLVFFASGIDVHLVAGTSVMSLGSQFPGAVSLTHAVIATCVLLFCLVGIWASNRSIPFFGTEDPHQAVVDEVMGQIITFLFIPFTMSWPLILAGFVLFRVFDIWKPYPIDDLQHLSGGLGICADDIVAGVYAGICLSVIYAIMLSL
jgi:phosphatidylglycerophosphatase A